MLFTVDWIKLVQLQVPQWMRRKRLVVWLLVCISGVRSLHATFLNYRKDALYSMHITGQTIYLEMALNDRFDFVNRDIYIVTATDAHQFYLYNRLELAAPVYFYNKYNALVPYAAGEFAIYKEARWKALVANPTNPPGIVPGEWMNVGPRLFLKNLGEGNALSDFIVRVPATLLFDLHEMRALIDLYKLAGKTYTIQTY